MDDSGHFYKPLQVLSPIVHRSSTSQLPSVAIPGAWLLIHMGAFWCSVCSLRP